MKPWLAFTIGVACAFLAPWNLWLFWVHGQAWSVLGFWAALLAGVGCIWTLLERKG